MEAGALHAAAVCVPADHPALPGHFPGRPIVPGVVLLECVLSEAERWLGHALAVRELAHAKFSAPLPPGQSAQLQLRLNDTELHFDITHAGKPLAQGMFRLAPGPGA